MKRVEPVAPVYFVDPETGDVITFELHTARFYPRPDLAKTLSQKPGNNPPPQL